MSNMTSDAKACFSSKVEYRAIIQYLFLKGKTGKEMQLLPFMLGVCACVCGSVRPS